MVSDQRQAADSLVEVRVEIPRGSRNKYEYDPDRQMFRLDRRLFSATVYPADYGFIYGHRLLPVCCPTAPTFGTAICSACPRCAVMGSAGAARHDLVARRLPPLGLGSIL